jgi:hypothetical protein
MAPTHPTPAAPEAGRRLAYRLAIPAAALLLYAVLALLWRCGPHALYFDVLGLFGFAPFRFPFLDIHAVLAAAQCQRQGIDVYLSNPCDVLGRPHVYSPLWLALTPRFLDTSATTAVGLGLDLMFILSLAVVICPATSGEVLVLALAALSPMTVYALERANNDLVVFLLIVGGCALDRAPRPWRLGCYALYLFAGLLKYYPLVLLVLLARERRREGFVAAGLAALVTVFLLIHGHADLAKALRNIPALSYFGDSFSALNLPFGLVEAVGGARSSCAIGVLLLGLLAAVAIARTRRTVRLLDAAALDWNGCEAQCLLVGALLVTACFFAGQNVDYRGVYFVLIVPGLVRLHRFVDDRAVTKFLARMIAAVLFVAWEEPMRRAVRTIADAIASDWLRPRIELLFWIGRELVWWWLIAGLAAIVLSYVLRMPFFDCNLAALGTLRLICGESPNSVRISSAALE